MQKSNLSINDVTNLKKRRDFAYDELEYFENRMLSSKTPQKYFHLIIIIIYLKSTTLSGDFVATKILQC